MVRPGWRAGSACDGRRRRGNGTCRKPSCHRCPPACPKIVPCPTPAARSCRGRSVRGSERKERRRFSRIRVADRKRIPERTRPAGWRIGCAPRKSKRRPSAADISFGTITIRDCRTAYEKGGQSCVDSAEPAYIRLHTAAPISATSWLVRTISKRLPWSGVILTMSCRYSFSRPGSTKSAFGPAM
jgi:hypothetical protein